jgi:hypothetical protein
MAGNPRRAGDSTASGITRRDTRSARMGDARQYAFLCGAADFFGKLSVH